MEPCNRAIWCVVNDPVGQDDCLSWVSLFGDGRNRRM